MIPGFRISYKSTERYSHDDTINGSTEGDSTSGNGRVLENGNDDKRYYGNDNNRNYDTRKFTPVVLSPSYQMEIK